MQRIESLRKLPLENAICLDEFFYVFYKNYLSKSDKMDFSVYADAFYDAFSNFTPVITEGELIVGKAVDTLTAEARKDWEENYLQPALKMTENAMLGQDSHMAIDYELVLSEGLNSIIAKIDGYLASCEEDKKPFYESCKKCLQAVIKHSENYAEKAYEMAEKTDNEDTRAELLKLAEICKKVPANPAESFHEAVQSAHFITYAVSLNPLRIYARQQFQLGHPDRYLLPYYLKDIENGSITPEYAQLLLDCLAIQINQRVPNGLSSGYMVGGRDEKGNIVQNDLTVMGMQVIDDVRLVYPSVGLCWTEGMEQKYLEKACDILSHGRSHPAIFNDDIITKGLLSYGVPEHQAHSYIHSTCVEITPVAASNVWVASPYTNMPQILLDCMDREYESYNDLEKELFARLDRSIKDNFEHQNSMRKIRAEQSINPLLSCLVNDCLKLGLDIEQGGALYNWITPSFVGMANLVDSLYVVNKIIFEDKEMSIAQLKEILDRNFEGEELFRQKVLNKIAKYGNDIDDIDCYFERFTKHIIEECKKYEGMHQNGNIIPSVFCWIMHEFFGRDTGATPDGRLKGFPLGDGSGPCQGREMNGPTASIISSTKWEHHELIGGVAVNMKFSKKSLGEQSLVTMRNIIETYLKRGGFEIQINVIDKETLEKARINPEEYRDLVVRIGGYSDYFVKLSENMQAEVILRTEHNI